MGDKMGGGGGGEATIKGIAVLFDGYGFWRYLCYICRSNLPHSQFRHHLDDFTVESFSIYLFVPLNAI